LCGFRLVGGTTATPVGLRRRSVRCLLRIVAPVVRGLRRGGFGAVAALLLAAGAASITPLDLGAGAGRTDPGADSSLAPCATEKAGAGLLEDLELGIIHIDTELVESEVLRLLDRAGSDFDPFHGN
jgi:hypothetical protein